MRGRCTVQQNKANVTRASSSKDEMMIGGLYVIDGIDVVATRLRAVFSCGPRGSQHGGNHRGLRRENGT